MPYFVCRGYDAAGMAGAREQLRSAHRAHLQSARDDVEVAAGGMLLSDDGTGIAGSMLIVRADDIASAERFMQADPYAQGNIFCRVEIERWDWGIGAPDRAAGTVKRGP